MGNQGWDETREGAAAEEWVEIYVAEVIQALDDGSLASARHLTGPGFIAEGLQGLGIAEFVLRRTIALADQAPTHRKHCRPRARVLVGADHVAGLKPSIGAASE